jgi:hypothetical protein
MQDVCRLDALPAAHATCIGDACMSTIDADAAAVRLVVLLGLGKAKLLTEASALHVSLTTAATCT